MYLLSALTRCLHQEEDRSSKKKKQKKKEKDEPEGAAEEKKKKKTARGKKSGDLDDLEVFLAGGAAAERHEEADYEEL